MTETFNIISTTELELKLMELYHIMEINSNYSLEDKF